MFSKYLLILFLSINVYSANSSYYCTQFSSFFNDKKSFQHKGHLSNVKDLVIEKKNGYYAVRGLYSSRLRYAEILYRDFISKDSKYKDAFVRNCELPLGLNISETIMHNNTIAKSLESKELLKNSETNNTLSISNQYISKKSMDVLDNNNIVSRQERFADNKILNTNETIKTVETNSTLYNETKKALDQNRSENFIDFLDYNNTMLRQQQSSLYMTMKNFNNNSIFIDKKDLNITMDSEALTAKLKDIRDNNKEYIEILYEQDPFTGLYLKGEYEEYLNKFEELDNERYQSSRWKYKVQLRWEIFDDGYFESKKNIDRKSLETKLQYLQLVNNMIEHDFNNKIYESKLFLNEINLFYHINMKNMYKELFEKRRVLKDMGIATFEDVQRLQMKVNYHNIYEEHYNAQPRKKIDKRLYNFLNVMEYIKLVDKEKLYDSLVTNNTDIQIQNLFGKRSEFFPEFLDNFRLNVYAKHEKRDKYGDQDSLGVYVDIPLQTNQNRSQIIELEKGKYKLQTDALKIRLKQKIAYYYQHFDYINAQIKGLKEELKFLYHRRTNLAKQSQYELLENNKDIVREFELNKIKIFINKYNIIQFRLKNYINFLNLYRISGFDNMMDIIENDITFSY